MLIDTHCHIHESGYVDKEAAYHRAKAAGIEKLICIGTDLKSSQEAVAFAQAHDDVFAAVGVHPHEAKYGPLTADIVTQPKVVAIGEIGLDYYYSHSPKSDQMDVLRRQIELALEHNLPISFHVRDAFDDFWPIFDSYTGIRGVLHSFTDTSATAQAAIRRGLYFGVNGIATFARDKQAMYRQLPLERLVVETDAPFLTPKPLRGTINEPANSRYVADHIATLLGVSPEVVAEHTTANAMSLFGLN